MRILIDTTFAQRAPLSGTGVYIERVLSGLSQFGSDVLEVVPVANPARRVPAGGGAGSVRNLLSDLTWTTVTLPRLARRHHADLVHHPLPVFASPPGAAQLITVHDTAFALFPELFARGYGTYARVSHRAAARRATGVVCVSEATAADVRRLWGVRGERITVAPLGPGQELSAPDRVAGAEAQHFLYVGDDEPRKNLGVLLTAYGRYRASAGAEARDLVLAGGVAGRRGLTPGVRVVERPSAAVLAGLYRQAIALVHPAVHEGFGLTPLEAMRLGTPVIAAPSAGVREVCADAVRYADASDPAAFAAEMTAVAGSAPLREELSRLGRVRAGQFSWERCARAHLDAYRRALTG